MEKFLKYLPLCIMISLIVAAAGEFILCFARGYEELWYTILVPGLIICVLAAAGYFTKYKWLYFIATAIIAVGAVLLIGFPAYVLYLGFILGGLSLVGEIILLVYKLKNKDK